MSNQQTVIPPTTGSVVTQVVVPSDKFPYIVLSASNLAGAEEVDIYLRSGSAWVVVADPSTGNAVKLTASIPTQTLRGGPEYGVLKDATAGACGVFVDYGVREY